MLTRTERQAILQLAANEAQTELRRKIAMIFVFVVAALMVLFRSSPTLAADENETAANLVDAIAADAR